MDKKIKILFILGIIIFAIVFVFINIVIKNYEKESTLAIPSQELKIEKAPLEKAKISETQKEEPEMEVPLPSNEPLLN